MYHDLLASYSEQSLRTALENGSWTHLKLKRIYLQDNSIVIDIYPDQGIVLTPRHEVLTPVIKWVSLPPFVINKRYLHQVTVVDNMVELTLDRIVSVAADDTDGNALSDVTWDITVSSLELHHAITNRILVNGQPFSVPVDIDTFRIWREYQYAEPFNSEEHSGTPEAEPPLP